MPAKNKINLLPQEEFEESTLGRILRWLLSSFRIIVVLVEVIVISGFLSRFWLDARNTDLDELIKQKKAVILADSTFEKEFTNTQKRLRIFTSLSQKEETNLLINQIGSHLPPDVKLKSVSFISGSVNIVGESVSEMSIHQFMTNLSSQEQFKDLTLANVSSNSDSLGILSFTLSLKKKG